MYDNINDTIAACATPPGKGGIGIVRVSGIYVKQITKKILGKLPKPRYATFSKFLNEKRQTIDEGIAIYFKAPHSFTGEDILELHGHGGLFILNNVLSCVLKYGARLAEPGEFSKRAFLNGKINLTQAEAIIDIVNATSLDSTYYALNSLQGLFSDHIYELVNYITNLRKQIEVLLNFSEEEISNSETKTIEEDSIKKIEKNVKAFLNKLLKIKQIVKKGITIQEGKIFSIVGATNVGKSSLINALCGENIAIVTDQPGTTRDLIKEEITINNFILKLIDTAGLRESDNIIELEGIKRTLDIIKKSYHVLLVIDLSQKKDLFLKNITQLLEEHFLENVGNLLQNKITIICNKIDLLSPDTINKLLNKHPKFTNLNESHNHQNISSESQKFNNQHKYFLNKNSINYILISAKQKIGIDFLKNYIETLLNENQTVENQFTARQRHLQTLESTEIKILETLNLINKKIPLEIIAEELSTIQKKLGEITGNFFTEDLLNSIFDEFCIGK